MKLYAIPEEAVGDGVPVMVGGCLTAMDEVVVETVVVVVGMIVVVESVVVVVGRHVSVQPGRRL
ncbi:MAG: hypothetical protein H7839_20260 [Magnetococcus sp. YQC-5]